MRDSLEESGEDGSEKGPEVSACLPVSRKGSEVSGREGVGVKEDLWGRSFRDWK